MSIDEPLVVVQFFKREALHWLLFNDYRLWSSVLDHLTKSFNYAVRSHLTCHVVSKRNIQILPRNQEQALKMRVCHHIMKRQKVLTKTSMNDLLNFE